VRIKRRLTILIFALGVTGATTVRAQNAGLAPLAPSMTLTPPPDAAAAPAPTPTPADTGAPGAEPVVPTADFDPSRYEALWTKSPFSVATPEAGDVGASPDYILVGLARVDGISYGSVIDRQSGEHFLISSDSATRGLRLSSISKSSDGTQTFASVLKDGQTLTLQLQQAPAAGPAPNGPVTPGAPMIMNGAPGAPGAPGTIVPNIAMPGSNPSYPGGGPRPFPRIHRPLIHLPPPPPEESSPGATPGQPR
jgi:hypothetical protein